MLSLRSIRYRCCRQVSGSVVAIAVVVCVCVYYLSSRGASRSNPLKDANFLELRSCPACYGRGLCSLFQSGHFEFTGVSRYRTLHRFNIKNVHYARMTRERQAVDVVLKKLGHNTELKAADEKICKMAQMNSCNPGRVLFGRIFRDSDPILTPENTKGLSDLVSCPSERLMKRIVDSFPEKQGDVLLRSERLIIYTTLLVNPEPILLQVFPQEEGWPFPRYIGACGRWTVTENAGESLNKYYNAPWQKRVDLAYQIFRIADLFTNNNQGWGLYFTDVNYDNYAVAVDGTVSIIDAENIIVVDLRDIKREKPQGWDEPLISNFDQCSKYGDCLSFDTSALCSHVRTDFNYYAVCRDLLSSYASDGIHPKGFLHDLPDEIEQKYKLTNMLDECAKPTVDSVNGRLNIKDEILETLKKISKLHRPPNQ
ncbi:divergent protein kinase domain 2A-like [Tubulanus polymorphus]|uniref:divergent protein kinase domain 2A-like n=1 Tax=Tubulanus polymorphus TaxID=672921 RepID=UPI003DA1DCB6